jgi:hypothetical protein
VPSHVLPGPICCNWPLPVAVFTTKLSERLIASAPLSTIAPGTDPAGPPPPSVSVEPPLIVVAPVNVLLPDRVSAPFTIRLNGPPMTPPKLPP